MKLQKLINVETGEIIQYTNSHESQGGSFAIALFCGNRIEDIQPAVVSPEAEAARSEFVAAIRSRIRSYENDAQLHAASNPEQSGIDQDYAFTLANILGRVVEEMGSDFWLANRTGYPERAEQILRDCFIDRTSWHFRVR